MGVGRAGQGVSLWPAAHGLPVARVSSSGLFGLRQRALATPAALQPLLPLQALGAARRLAQIMRSLAVQMTAVAVLALSLALEARARALPLPLAARPGPRAQRVDDRRLAISKYRNEPNAGDGAYRYEFELSDGSRRAEEGRVSAGGALQVRGSFSRPGFDGSMEEVMYYADEGGFHVAKMVPPLGAPPASLIASLVG